MRVTVLGAGSWGTTVASLAAGRNQTVLWARSPEVAKSVNEHHENPTYLAGFTLPTPLRATSDIEEAVSSAEVLVVGVPSHGFRAVIEQAAPHIPAWIPVVSLTKGFEAGTLFRMTEVIRDVLPGRPAAALTGPNLAKEIMAGNAAASVIATEDLSVARALQGVLRSGLFRVYINHDVIGCEVGGALKNVIAIATGIAQGLSVGDNTRAAVISRGLAELTRLGVAMGAEAATMAGLAGMGDLIATCVSPLSRNRTVGERLGQGERIEDILAGMTMVAEGVKTAQTVMDLAERYGVDLPICAQIKRVVTGQETVQDAYRGLMRARPGHESEPW
jgi:glycerol-3-phosphate dehydrogenase (NAD(P)+)